MDEMGPGTAAAQHSRAHDGGNPCAVDAAGIDIRMGRSNERGPPRAATCADSIGAVAVNGRKNGANCVFPEGWHAGSGNCPRVDEKPRSFRSPYHFGRRDALS